MLLKNVDYDALHFHMGSLMINIFKVFFWERDRGGHKKEYSVYAFDKVDNAGRPLKYICYVDRVGRYEDASLLFGGYQKLSELLKSSEKTGAGGGAKKSRPAASSSSGGVTNKDKSLLSIQFVSTLLKSLLA